MFFISFVYASTNMWLNVAESWSSAHNILNWNSNREYASDLSPPCYPIQMQT